MTKICNKTDYREDDDLSIWSETEYYKVKNPGSTPKEPFW